MYFFIHYIHLGKIFQINNNFNNVTQCLHLILIDIKSSVDM